MKRIAFFSITLLLSLIVFTGCKYTISGIDDYYFAIAIGIDLLDNDNIKLSIQIPKSSGNSESTSGSSQPSDYQIFSVEAKEFNQAITVLNNYLNKKLNLIHCSAIIISEDFAKNGLNALNTSLYNDTELKFNSQVIISSSTAESLLKNISNSGEVFSARLFDHLKKTSDYTGFTIEAPFGKFYEAIQSKDIEATAIYVTVNNDIVQTSRNSCF